MADMDLSVQNSYIWQIWSSQGGGAHLYMVDMVVSGRWRTLMYGRYGHIRAVAHISIW